MSRCGWQRIRVLSQEGGGPHELESAPRGGFRLDGGAADQVGTGQDQLAFGEGHPVGDRTGATSASVMFCDLVGSTTLGERCDPEVLRRSSMASSPR